MADRREENYRHAVAFVTHTREYASAELLPALARHGYTTTERPHDRETERLVTQFEPDLVVLAIDPRRDADIALIRSISRLSPAPLLILGPGPQSNRESGHAPRWSS